MGVAAMGRYHYRHDLAMPLRLTGVRREGKENGPPRLGDVVVTGVSPRRDKVRSATNRRCRCAMGVAAMGRYYNRHGSAMPLRLECAATIRRCRRDKGVTAKGRSWVRHEQVMPL
jgi:hypothetical protein